MAVGELPFEWVEGATVVESVGLQDVQVGALGARPSMCTVTWWGPHSGGRGYSGWRW